MAFKKKADAPPAEKKERNPDKIGALWLHRKNNNTFMSGRVTIPASKLTEDKDGNVTINFMVFKNTYKETDKQPDYNVLLPRDQRQNTGSPITDDDIPF